VNQVEQMKMGHRVFIIDGDAVEPLSHDRFNALYFRREPALPKFAGRTIQVAVVLYTLERRRPKEILHLQCKRIKIRQDGSIDKKHELESRLLSLDRAENPHAELERAGNVLQAKTRFNARKWEHRHPKLSGLAHKRILSALFR
jgi:hypothetical protein